ncbi:hypothetical protein BH11PAT2_BH11PAT2_06940 [soil metagenome]
MDEHRLEGLKSTSLPALRHAELVELARVHSPSQVYKLARTAKWPNRQAKAAQSLAAMRRDYGEEVFQTFVATMEHARSESSETEPAQDNRKAKKMTHDLARSLDRIKEPTARFRLAVKSGLTEQASETAITMFRELDATFWTFQEDSEILFDTLIGVSNSGGQVNDESQERWQKHRERTLVCFIASNDQQMLVDLDGMISFFGWSDEIVTDLVSGILEKIAASEPRKVNWRGLTAVTRVCRRYLATDSSLARATELWLLRSHIRNGRTFELRNDALPRSLPNAPDEVNELDPIVDRFIELGWTNEQVHDEFMAIITPLLENCRPQWMLAFVGAKCFNMVTDHRDGELGKLLREKYRPYLWSNLAAQNDHGGFYAAMYSKFLYHGLKSNDRDEERLFYREKLIELIVQGRLTRTWQIILSIGHRASLFYAELESSLFTEARKYLLGLLPDAFARAYAIGNYGTAAALVQTFGADALSSVPDTAAHPFFEAEFDAVDVQHAEAVKLSFELEDDDPRYVAWQSATDAVVGRREQKLAELREERKSQIADATQIAIDLGQAVCFTDTLSYVLVPHWPKS